MFTKNTSLIIPTRNRVLFLKKLLTQLKYLKIHFKEILIIDSSDIEHKNDIGKICKFFKCKLYNSKSSISIQRNLGLKKRKKQSKYVMFMDDDIFFKKKAFINMDRTIKRYDKSNFNILGYGFNQNKRINKNFIEILKQSKFSQIFGLYSDKSGVVMSSGWQTKILNLQKDIFTDWIHTGAVVFPSTIINIKFNEDFGRYSYLEDLDFSLNLRKNKKNDKFLLVFAAKFLHPNDIERIDYNFGVIELLNRFLIVKKYELNIPYFFYIALIKSLMTLLMSFKNVNNIYKFFGNVTGIFLSFKILISSKIK